jgi:hypothetical protein
MSARQLPSVEAPVFGEFTLWLGRGFAFCSGMVLFFACVSAVIVACEELPRLFRFMVAGRRVRLNRPEQRDDVLISLAGNRGAGLRVTTRKDVQ